MDLDEFIESCFEDAWIDEPGLEYFVRKSIVYPGVIELANVMQSRTPVFAAYFKFLKKYEDRIPFYAELVGNKGLVRLYEKRGWLRRPSLPSPDFASPLMIVLYEKTDKFQTHFYEIPELIQDMIREEVGP